MILTGALAVFVIVFVFAATKIVPQSQEWVVERLGKYRLTLKSGFHVIIPGVDKVAHKVSILERQLPEYPIDAITKDNAPISVTAATFFRVTHSHQVVYRIANIEQAIQSLVTGIVRAEIGKIDFDALQYDRASVSQNLEKELEKQAQEWGIEITRSELVDVTFDEETKRALQMQINAERERRAVVTRAEGAKRAAELTADAELYTAQKEAEARIVRANAEADATRTVSAAIAEAGDHPIRLELINSQIKAMEKIGASESSKTVLIPSDITGTLAGLSSLLTEFSGLIPTPKANKVADVDEAPPQDETAPASAAPRPAPDAPDSAGGTGEGPWERDR